VSEKMPVAFTTTFARIRRSAPVSASRATTPQVWRRRRCLEDLTTSM
jgi:hypothetical protein